MGTVQPETEARKCSIITAEGGDGEWGNRNKRIGEPESGRKGVIETVVGENGRTEEVNRRTGDREKKRGR